jgi:hypothetical protein
MPATHTSAASARVKDFLFKILRNCFLHKSRQSANFKELSVRPSALKHRELGVAEAIFAMGEE